MKLFSQHQPLGNRDADQISSRKRICQLQKELLHSADNGIGAHGPVLASVNSADALLLSVATTWMVKVAAPPYAGAPLSRPLSGSSTTPVGKAPAVMLQA